MQKKRRRRNDTEEEGELLYSVSLFVLDSLFQANIQSCFIDCEETNKGGKEAQRELQEALLVGKKLESKRSFHESGLYGAPRASTAM